MGNRRGVRPIGSWVPYEGRNWVIGGTEPNSYAEALGEQQAARLAGWLSASVPTRITRTPLRARYEAQCWYCRSRIRVDAPIHRVKLGNGSLRWVHAACSES